MTKDLNVETASHAMQVSLGFSRSEGGWLDGWLDQSVALASIGYSVGGGSISGLGCDQQPASRRVMSGLGMQKSR